MVPWRSFQSPARLRGVVALEGHRPMKRLHAGVVRIELGHRGLGPVQIAQAQQGLGVMPPQELPHLRGVVEPRELPPPFGQGQLGVVAQQFQIIQVGVLVLGGGHPPAQHVQDRREAALVVQHAMGIAVERVAEGRERHHLQAVQHRFGQVLAPGGQGGPQHVEAFPNAAVVPGQPAVGLGLQQVQRNGGHGVQIAALDAGEHRAHVIPVIEISRA